MPEFSIMAGHGGKKNFEFRMSKKVAELTQVVHMLFTRNHEKEVEMEALRAAYESEIGSVLDEARTKIQDLEARLADLEREKATLGETIEASLKEACILRETQLQSRIAELESQLSDEKRESHSSRDLLIQTQRDLDQLRRTHVDDIERRQVVLQQKDREIEMVKHRLGVLEQELREKGDLLDTKSDLIRTHERLRREFEQVKMNLEAVERSKEEMSARNRHLEADVKALKKELAKRLSERNNSAKTSAPVANGYTDTNQEVEHLKKQLERYRMELSNRENNFNRMFTEKQPVHVNDREPRRSSTRGRQGTAISLDQGRPHPSEAGSGVGPTGLDPLGRPYPPGAGPGMGSAGLDPLGRPYPPGAGPGVGPVGLDPQSGSHSRVSSERHYTSDVFVEEELRELPGTPNRKMSRSQSLKSNQSSASDRLPQVDRPHALNLVKPRMPRELLTSKR